MIVAVIVLGSIGFIFAVLLAVLNNKLKVSEDPKVELIIAALPGINCGACGFSGCKAYARAVVDEHKIFNGCLPGGTELNDKISEIIGVGVTGTNSQQKKIAVCKCLAGDKYQKKSNNYAGPKTCSSAHITGGAIDCNFGCIGYADCVAVCPVTAITITDGRISVDAAKCISCGICVSNCPRNLFSLIELTTGDVCVGCNNTDNALSVRKVCKAGCIGCGICGKLAPEAFEINNLLSHYNNGYDGDNAKVQLAQSKCPTKCIYDIK